MEISTEELAALINVSKAYGVRAYARNRSKSTKEQMEEDRADVNQFGMYDDCGPSYQSSFDASKRIFDAAVRAEVRSEKAFKKARLTAIEKHPSLEVLIAEFVYVRQGKEPAPAENQTQKFGS